MLSLGKLHLYLLFGHGLSLHPWVSKDLSYRWSMSWVKLEHALNKILEVLTVEAITFWLILGVSFPENIGSISSKASIEWV